MEYKLLDSADLKFAGDGAGELSGYASIFHNVDGQGERVMPGAFTKHLPAFLTDGFVALGHDWNSLPIATPIEAKEDERGLFVRAAFHSTPEAQAVRTVITERLARGKSVKLSIGYEVLDAEAKRGVRELKELKLHEWSYVAVPANNLAAVTYAKSGLLAGLPIEEQSETLLAGIKDYISRERDISTLRAKEGKPISSARRRRMNEWKDTLAMLIDDLAALLAETETPSKSDLDELNNIYEKWSNHHAFSH